MNPLPTWILRMTALAILIVLAAGCGDDDPVAPTWPGVVKITVDETSSGTGWSLGHVFTSLEDGTLLEAGTWTGPEVLELEIPTVLGEGYWVTQVKQDGPGPVLLYTTHHTVTGRDEVDLSFHRLEASGGDVTVEFVNIPPHQGYKFYGGGYGVNTSNSLPNSIWLSLNYQPADLLLILKDLGTAPTYLWSYGVTPGSNPVFDLVDREPIVRTSIPLPATPGDLYCRLNGYKVSATSGVHHRYYLDIDYLTAPLPAAWETDFLAPGFDGYELVIGGSKISGLERQLTTTGGLPGTLAFWDLEMTVNDPSPDLCRVETSGHVDELEASWAQPYAAPQWTVTVQDGSRVILLPRLPSGLVEQEPGLVRENFSLESLMATREAAGLAGDGITPMVTTDQVTVTF